jgi:hypothetical protein
VTQVDAGGPDSRPPSIPAQFAAQRIALGPLVFQAARLLRDMGILEALRRAPAGLGRDEVARRVGVAPYGVTVLLDAGLAAGLLRAAESRYVLTETGLCLLADELTRVNMDAVHHCLYQALYYLEDSIRQGEPVGLHEVFGRRGTIYPALTSLPEPVQQSWFRWDHHFSALAFPQALPLVFARPPRTLLDVGGNTGEWAFRCVAHAGDVSVTIMDLPQVLALTERTIAERGLSGRIGTHAMDLLDHSRPFPRGFDAVWMSQLLVCFSEADVLQILERAAAAMEPAATLYVLDNFWDRQRHEIGTFCLQLISLYFTCLANGRSRMYRSTDAIALIEAAGFRIERVVDRLGLCSSLIVCRKVATPR